jgi:hypothetical protein
VLPAISPSTATVRLPPPLPMSAYSHASLPSARRPMSLPLFCRSSLSVSTPSSFRLYRSRAFRALFSCPFLISLFTSINSHFLYMVSYFLEYIYCPWGLFLAYLTILRNFESPSSSARIDHQTLHQNLKHIHVLSRARPRCLVSVQSSCPIVPSHCGR